MPACDDAHPAPRSDGGYARSLLTVGGACGRLIAQKDWSQTELGPIEDWPPSLKTCVSLIVASHVPMTLLWGQSGLLIYNDGYAEISAGRHPEILGMGAREAWPEASDFNDHVIHSGLSGQTLAFRDLEMTLNRSGTPESVWFDIDYSPVRDSDGAAVGILAIVVETTRKVLVERAAAAERESQARSLRHMPGFVATLDGPDHVFTYVNEAYRTIAGARDYLGHTVRDIFPDVASQGFYELLDQVYHSGQPFVSRSFPLDLSNQAETRYIDFIYQPVFDDKGAVTGIFVGGYDVTEHKRAEDALKALNATLEERVTQALAERKILADVVEATEAFIHVIDTDYNWRAINRATIAEFEHLFGVTPRVGSNLLEVLSAHPDAVSHVRALWDRGLAGENLVTIDEFGGEGRERRAYEIRIAPLYDTEGRIIGAYQFAYDVTQRLEQDAILLQTVRELEERDRLWSLSQDPFLIANSDGRWLKVSSAWTRLLGWTAEDLIGKTSHWLEHPDDHEKTRIELRSLSAGGNTWRFENRLRDREGQYRTFSWTANEENGLLYCVARDITEDIRRARELEDSRDFARLALGAVDGIGVWTYDVASDLFHYDEGIASVYALDPKAGLSGIGRKAFLAHVHPEDRDALRATMAEGLTRQGDIELEYRLIHPDGSVHWVLSRGHTHFENGKPVRRIGVGIDVTAKRQLEEQLRQSQKMEAVGQLTGGIAHDFNNMLAVVMGSLELLNRRIGPEDVRARHYVTQGLEGAKRAANLTQRLLAFSRQQPLRPETVNVNRLVGGMSELLAHSLGGAIQLETVLAAGAWPVHVDPNQLENVLLNLGVNARDAMPDGGRLTIETQNAHLDSRYVAEEIGVATGQYVLIAVTDTGCGMPPDVMARAFDPFFTTKGVGKGTGLGLSQVYGFVKQSNGHVRIYSEPGQGTTVKIYLPRLTGADAVAPDNGPSEGILLPGEARDVILVVDDEAVVRRFSCDALTELGYRVLEADSAATALRLLDEHPEVRLLFTDIVMPEINGRKLADAAQKVRPDLKVLFTSGYTRNTVVHNGVVDAGVELIGKPFSIEELAARVREMLDRKP
ncbi:PAS domain-containing protein [Asticcacaulis sp. DW145]|uniref:PAS domain-containing protein n=1 Tax=Asticcacaulis sp. DW145 TaxID=3095608 RepID=UPI0030882EC4|nr:PAS domain-containing protein [Asticcacaulis sp. DW145]